MTVDYTVLDDMLKAAVVRGDAGQEMILEAAATRLGQPLSRPQPAPLLVAGWYVQRNMRLFPVMPGSKRPYPRSNGVKDATCSPAALAGWFGEAAPGQVNYGVATGDRFDVIDIDGPEGMAAFGEMIGDGAWLDVRAVSQTPRGLHIWIPAAPGARNGASANRRVDFRAKGGYVVVPPSIVDGRLYRWLAPPTI